MFLKVHIFPFSKRENTKAFNFKEETPKAIINERKKILDKLSKEKAYILRDGYLKKRMKILIEKEKTGYFIGHSDNFFEVKIFDKDLCKNQIIEVMIVKNTKNGLIGEKI